MPPPCPATSSSQCHPAVSGSAVGFGGVPLIGHSALWLYLLLASLSILTSLRQSKKILKKLHTLKTGVCESNLQDGIVWHIRFGKEQS